MTNKLSCLSLYLCVTNFRKSKNVIFPSSFLFLPFPFIMRRITKPTTNNIFFHRNPLCQEAASIVSSGTCSKLGDTLYECYQVFGDINYGYANCVRESVYPSGGMDRFKVRPSCLSFPRSLRLFHSHSRGYSGSEYSLILRRDV